MATEADFQVALELAAPSIQQASDELGPNARDVLELVASKGLSHWTIKDLRTLKPEWSYHRFYSGLGELVRMEIVKSQPRTKPALYDLMDTTVGRDAPVVSLRAPQPIFASLGAEKDSSQAQATG